MIQRQSSMQPTPKASAAQSSNPSVEHRNRIPFANQFRFEIEIKIKTAISFRPVQTPGHKEVGGVMVPLRLHQAAVECGQFRICLIQPDCEHLKFLATSPLDQRRANQMVD